MGEAGALIIVRPASGNDSLIHLQTMDRDILVNFEPQLYFCTTDRDDGDLKHSLRSRQSHQLRPIPDFFSIRQALQNLMFHIGSGNPVPSQAPADMLCASRNTCTMPPVANTCITVPVLGSTSAPLPHGHARDSFNLLSERFAGIGKQLPMKLLYLHSTCGIRGQNLFRWR